MTFKKLLGLFFVTIMLAACSSTDMTIKKTQLDDVNTKESSKYSKRELNREQVVQRILNRR